MRQLGIVGAFALLVFGSVSTPSRADLAPTVVRSGGQTVVQVAEGIAIGRVTSMNQAIQLLGSQEAGASLWQAIKALEAQKGLPLNSTDWAAIRDLVGKQNLTTGAVVAQFKLAADSRTVLSASNASLVFGQAQASVAPSYQQTASTTTAEEAFTNYTAKSDETRTFQSSLLGNWARSARTRIATIGAMLLIAMNTTPSLCSASAREYCQQNAPELVMKWGALGIDKGGPKATTFMNSALTAFQNEPENFVGKEEVIVRGGNEALNMGDAMPGQVKACFWTGTPVQQ